MIVEVPYNKHETFHVTWKDRLKHDIAKVGKQGSSVSLIIANGEKEEIMRKSKSVESARVYHVCKSSLTRHNLRQQNQNDR